MRPRTAQRPVAGIRCKMEIAAGAFAFFVLLVGLAVFDIVAFVKGTDSRPSEEDTHAPQHHN